MPSAPEPSSAPDAPPPQRTAVLAPGYDPAPPFVGGTPQTAGPETVAAVRAMTADVAGRMPEVARRARRRMVA